MKSWHEEEKDQKGVVDAVAHLVLILSLGAVLACSIRIEMEPHTKTIDKIINRELIDSTKLDTVGSTNTPN